jgi:chromate transporter
VPRLRRSQLLAAFLDAVNVAALALMVAVTIELGRAALVDWITIAFALLSAVLLLRFRMNSALLILSAAALGMLAQMLLHH